ncbi:hypothetical protein [uncultured Legionella sp.]|uniref:hypothetical protein n=1 Tax=uncultured Legionella sp. TaxID=210934 RepID=UPI00260B47FC|nr:hypothetical protein [uncultured Legionella sp.]
MKKIVLSLGLGLALAASTVSADSILDQLNNRVADVLTSYQNPTTTAQLSFNEVETDETHAVKIALNGLYRKIGSQNTFELKIDNLSYNYADNKDPITVFKGGLGIDITKILPQDQINLIIPMASELLEELAKNYTEEEYGDAASVRSVITSTAKDTEGNFTALSALISAKIDLSKLPEETDKASIRFTDIVISLAINLNTGVMIDAYMVSNPDYFEFSENETGLKEILDSLLSGDEEALEGIKSIFESLDDTASLLVEMSNELKSRILSQLHLKKA